MDDSIPHAKGGAAFWDVATWKAAVSGIAAILLGIVFMMAGVWKITDPFSAAVRLEQAQAPHSLSLIGAVLLGIGETFAGVLLVVPRFRRWGAWLTGLMLVFFLVYIAAYYNVLRGEECNCFPWIKRAVGPAFFIGDGVMLVMAFLAGLWARPAESRRSAGLVLGAIAVFAMVSYGFGAVRQSWVRAPASITVDGKPVSLQQGRVFLYFFDPECAHCDQAARWMGQYQWSNVTLISVPTANAQFARQFVESTGFRSAISTEVEKLRQVFSFVDAPYAVALENGRQRVAFTHFDPQEPEATLRRLGYVK